MPTVLTIQNTYHDALFFASSRINLKQKFYLKPSEYKLLIKLIHYSKTYEEITYQIKDIAKHTFMDEFTIKDCLEALTRKGYTSIKKDVYHKHLGYTSKVTRYINWDFISSLAEMTGEFSEAESIDDGFENVETPIVDEPKQITNEIDTNSMKKEELKQRFIDKVKYAPVGKCLSPAEFHYITRDYFIGYPMDLILGRIKPFDKTNPNGFVEMVYGWVAEIRDNNKAVEVCQ